MKHELSRGEFLKALGASAAFATTGCIDTRMSYAVPRDQLMFAALLHLGKNMWDDFDFDPDNWAKSLEEMKVKPNPFTPQKPDPKTGERKRSRYRNFVITDEAIFRESIDRMAALGYNTVFIDLGEAVEYPSHPELKVTGTWSVEKVRDLLDYIRSLGMEPLPKMNFSAGHDSWLKMYHRMVSSQKYYQVVSDVIKDACDIFEGPRFVHIGYDEEMPISQEGHFFPVVRQGDLWWHDVNFTIGEVEKNRARTMMWADAMWTGRDEFVKRMSKGVLLQNWYYRSDFSEKKMKWDYAWEKKGGWGETRHGAASYKVLDDAGFDQLPCTSNYFEDGSADAVLGYCKDNLNPALVKGYMTAPWFSCVEKTKKKLFEGLELFAAAKRKHFPELG